MIQQFISKLSEKEKKFLYITILIVGIALLDVLFLGPALNKLSAVDKEIEQQENGITRDLRFLSYEDRIVKESEAFEKYYIRDLKDEDVVNAEFLQVVEKLATESQVDLVKSNPTEMKTQKHFLEYYASLDCSGKLKDVVSFVHKINSTDELLKVVKFNMASQRGSENAVNASMTIVKMIINPDISHDTSVTP